MIPQAAPLYGYAWPPGTGPDEEPDHVMVIGWEPEHEDEFVSYRPVVAALDATGAGNAFALGDDWTWHLTAGDLDESEGFRIKAAHERRMASLKRQQQPE
jgi:hypothetical protein